MNNISKLVFDEYNLTNIIMIIVKRKRVAAFTLRSLIIILLILGFFYSLELQSKNILVSLVFMFISEFFILWIYEKAIRFAMRQLMINSKRLLKPQELARIQLKNILKVNNLYTREGVEYLIDMYIRKNRIVQFSWFAIIGIILSAVISSITTILISGSTEDFQRLIERLQFFKLIIDSNMGAIISVSFFIILFAIMSHLLFKNVKSFLLTLFGFRYGSLLYDLEYYILPELICLEKNRSNSRRNNRTYHKNGFRG